MPHDPVGGTRDLVANDDIVGWFDGFFGKHAEVRYRLVPGLLNGPSNYGARAARLDGSEEFYQIVSLENLDDEELPRPSDVTAELIVHEMAHSYVNPIVDRHLEELRPSLSHIFPLVAKAMASQAYGRWETMARESGVRAVTILFLRDRRGKRAAAQQVRDEQRNSFFWVGELADQLEAYRADRARYPTLDAFIPQVVSFFDGLADRYAHHGLPRVPYFGPINAAYERDPVVVIAPQGAASGPLLRYVTAIQRHFGRQPPLAPVAAQIEPGRTLVLYGSPRTNPHVAALLADSRWSVEPGAISVAGRRFEGAHLVLIATRPHPADRTSAALVYTAASDEDLVGVNGTFHGPTDWVVARKIGDQKFEIEAQGDFERQDGAWRLDREAK